jgi:plastocyanin
MSIWGHRVSRKAVAALACLLVALAMVPAWSWAPDREVVLVVRGMAFYTDSQPDIPNPTIEVRAGERVRVVLRNDDRGLVHDFAVPALDRGLDAIRWNETSEVTFTVPTAPGSYEYVCRPHALMMRGKLNVVAP